MELENLNICIASPNATTRTKLREVLKAVTYKASIQQVTNLSTPIHPPANPDKPNFLFVGFSVGKEAIAHYMDSNATLAQKDRPTVIVTMDSKIGDSATCVAGLYLKGIAGFISEPYSTTELSSLLTTLINNPPLVEDKNRALKAVGFLLADAMSQLDQLAAQRMKGNDSGGYAQKELKNIAKDLELSYEANPDGYIKVICDVFEKAKPPADSLVRSKVRRNVVRLVHPGTIVREMMKQRMLTAERIATAVKMELPDFEALLDGKRDLNEELAKELARVLGRSSREWMKLQTDYDANKPKQPQA